MSKDKVYVSFKGCGEVLGSMGGYTMRCGGLWCGGIAYCRECNKKRELK